ncbi:phage tail tip fiber protein, partial [Pseudomonas typographi]
VVQSGQVYISQAFIADGTITSAKIGDYIQSTNYVAGSTGWRMNKDGTFEINGTVSGQGRLLITNSLVQVFDANGGLRVRMGIWA